MNTDELSFLKDRDIIDILIGDKALVDFEKFSFIDFPPFDEIKMPYYTGPKICELSQKIGFHQEYSNLSRWEYMYDLIDYAINNNKVSILFDYIFEKIRFKDVISAWNLSGSSDIHIIHNDIIVCCIDNINKIAAFYDRMIFYTEHKIEIISTKQKEQNIMINCPTIKNNPRQYISDTAKKAFEEAFDDINKDNYDNAVTKSRTIIEEVLKFGIEEKDQEPEKTGDIQKLYSQFKPLYNMTTNKELDKEVKDLLSGLNKIISSIGNIRNMTGDSHGLGKNRIAIKSYHARLVVNSAITTSNFLLDVISNNKATKK